MDDRLLHSFLTVAHHMNMTAAAEKLHLTQSALSRQIQKLEGQLGITLFDRLGKRLKVTAEGEALLSRMTAVLVANKKLREGANELRNGEAGVLRVGACSQVIERFFPELLKQWNQENPFVEIRLEEGGGAELNRKQIDGDLHIALTASTYANSTETNSVKLCTMTLLAVANPTFLEALDGPVDISELGPHPLMVLNNRHAVRELFDSACRLAGLVPNIRLESASPHTLLSLAVTGCGIAVVPSTTRMNRSNVVLRPIAFEDKIIAFDISALWPRMHPLPEYGRRFIAMLEAHIGCPPQAPTVDGDNIITLAERRAL